MSKVTAERRPTVQGSNVMEWLFNRDGKVVAYGRKFPSSRSTTCPIQVFLPQGAGSFTNLAANFWKDAKFAVTPVDDLQIPNLHGVLKDALVWVGKNA